MVLVNPDYSLDIIVIPISKKYAKKAWNVSEMMVSGFVHFMTILVQGSYVEVLLESNVIAYVTILANLQYAWTLTMTTMAILTNVTQMKEM